MNRFATLMQREWMQHQTGFMIVMALPVVLVVLAGAFGQFQFEVEDADVFPTPLVMGMAALAVVTLATLGLTWISSVVMAPSLARRDVQDRSIEFWLSLPTSHTQSLAAPLLMHLLLVPLLALGVGLAGGVLASLVVVARGFGVGEWLALPWGGILVAVLVVGLRLALGLLLATLWLSPLILLTMAASAWFKRWGTPIAVGGTLVAGAVLEKVYGNPAVWTVLNTLTQQASQAAFVSDRSHAARSLAIQHPGELPALLSALPGWALGDAGHALAALASPAFVGAMLGAAAGFGLLWWRRQRGA